MSNSPSSIAHLACEKIKQHLPHFKPTIGIVLGSGLGGLASHLKDAVTIAYEDLPGFPKVTVEGHSGKMVLGYSSGIGVICLQGRSHSYEGGNYDAVKTYVRTLKLLGCEYFIATNASGSLRENVSPGELMLITDHINLQPSNPLVGENDEAFGPRFLPLDNLYDKQLKTTFLTLAQQHNIHLHQGVYLAVLGPHYETAAEIRAFRLLGADAVGMSTIPEVLVAHHCGMKVAVIATITNYATGLSKVSHDHANVVATANHTSKTLSQLIQLFIESLREKAIA